MLDEKAITDSAAVMELIKCREALRKIVSICEDPTDTTVDEAAIQILEVAKLALS